MPYSSFFLFLTNKALLCGFISLAAFNKYTQGPWQPADEEEEEAYLTFLEELIAENNNGKTNWTQGRLHKSVAAIFGVLHVAPRGLPRIELRNAARAFVGDTGLLDYTIKVLVNKVLCGFFMKVRSVCLVNRCHG